MAVSKPKISKATIKNLKRKKNKPFLRLTNLWLVVGVILIFSILINLFNTSLEANEIPLNEMLSKIKDNEYSALDLRDDGRIVAQDKYVYAAELEGDISLRESDDTNINKDLDELTVEELIGHIKPLSFTELLNTIKEPSSIVRISSIYIGDDFIIANNNDKGSNDFIIYAGEDELKDALKKEGVTISQLQTEVNFLRIAVSQKDQLEIEELNQNEIFSDVWVVDNLVFAQLKEDEINLDFVWRPQGSVFTELLQNE